MKNELSPPPVTSSKKSNWNREELYAEMEKVHVSAVCSALGCNTDDWRVPSLKKEFREWFNKNY